MELLRGLIDHAPLFPPASLEIGAAVAEDRRARASEHAWMLARFVCPASKLADLGAAMGWDSAPGLSVVLDGGEGLVRDAIDAGAPVAALEVRLESAGLVAQYEERIAALLAGRTADTFYEVALGDGRHDALAAVAEAGAKAKIRCGGENVPTVEQVAAFFAAARDAGVTFKATAGLHHPVRSDDAHGFLNFLAAAARAQAGAGEDELRALLSETDARRLPLGDGGRDLFVSIGSCSFFEPVEDLQALGML